MENRFQNSTPPNYFKRRLAGMIFFAVFFIFLGRHLTFLPTINLSRASAESDLKEEVEEIIKDKKGFYSVYFKDLDSGSYFGIDETQIETGASVNKLPIVAALYQLDKEGKISLDERVTINEDDIQNYGTGSIRYQKMPQTYSLRNLAKLSLKESDNTAAHVIGVKIGVDKIQDMVNSWGLEQTDMENNKTTAQDMAILLEKIYKNEVADERNTKELLNFLTDTEFEDRLSAKLPSSANVHHKTGDGEGFVHDVGIIQTEDKAYVLGVMTSDIGEEEASTKETIAEISKKIFDSLDN
jgi:beta-lactamase class A